VDRLLSPLEWVLWVECWVFDVPDVPFVSLLPVLSEVPVLFVVSPVLMPILPELTLVLLRVVVLRPVWVDKLLTLFESVLAVLKVARVELVV